MRRAVRATTAPKLEWGGRILGVQPRIRLMRSYDQSHHAYLGYVLSLVGSIGEFEGEVAVGVGNAAHAKHRFEAGMVVAGVASPVEDPAMETAQYYKASGIRVHAPATGDPCPPPWRGCPPTLEVYRARGPRRLDTKTYRAKCRGCLWGCDMPVEITVDQWNPKRLQHRRETFCYGPKSCPLYRAGPIRKVPGRKGMVWEEAEWVDEMNTEHRDWDE